MKINRKKPTYVFIIFIIERKIIFDLIILQNNKTGRTRRKSEVEQLQEEAAEVTINLFFVCFYYFQYYLVY